MSEVLKEVLVSLIYLGIVTLVPILAYAVKKGSTALIAYLQTKTDNEVIAEILSEIITFTEEAVTYTMQTYVDSLKKNGQFTKEAQEEAFEMAMETAKQFISEESTEMFESVYGNLDEYLKVLIEAKVKELKLESTN